MYLNSRLLDKHRRLIERMKSTLKTQSLREISNITTIDLERLEMVSDGQCLFDDSDLDLIHIQWPFLSATVFKASSTDSMVQK